MNKGILKLIAVGVVGLMTFSNMALAKINHNADLYVSTGFPYQNLVERFDTVKIHYANSEQNLLRCRVELITDSQSTTALAQTISQKDFAKAPLKSCISRKEAIAALATKY